MFSFFLFFHNEKHAVVSYPLLAMRYVSGCRNPDEDGQVRILAVIAMMHEYGHDTLVSPLAHFHILSSSASGSAGTRGRLFFHPLAQRSSSLFQRRSGEVALAAFAFYSVDVRSLSLTLYIAQLVAGSPENERRWAHLFQERIDNAVRLMEVCVYFVNTQPQLVF